MVCACGVIILPARGVGECVVCVVYELEFTGSCWSFGGVGGDAVGVGFESGSTDLLVSDLDGKIGFYFL